MANDPFSLTFDALWTLAEASVPLTNLVKVGNRIKFNQPHDRGPQKTSVQASDLPELILNTGGSTDANMLQSSCDTRIQRTYTWWLSTGDFRTNEILYPVQWALFCAMADWQTVLGALQWQGKPFIKLMNWAGLQEGMANAELNRGIEGWSSLWAVSVDMYFPTINLQNFNKQ